MSKGVREEVSYKDVPASKSLSTAKFLREENVLERILAKSETAFDKNLK